MKVIGVLLILTLLTVLGYSVSTGADSPPPSIGASEADVAPETPAAPPAPELPETESGLVGQAAPAFTLPDLEGNEVSLADFAGKIVVLDWYNCECPVVKAYYNDEAFMATMNEALGGQEDVVWLSIVSSAPGKQGHNPDVIRAAAPGFGKVNLTLRDESGSVGKAYGATATPTAYVINADGIVTYAGSFDAATNPGEAPKGTNFALSAVEAARAGEAPAVSTNDAFGCSVKY